MNKRTMGIDLVRILVKVVGYTAEQAQARIEEMRESDQDFESAYLGEMAGGVKGALNRYLAVELFLLEAATANDKDGRVIRVVEQMLEATRELVCKENAKTLAPLFVSNSSDGGDSEEVDS